MTRLGSYKSDDCVCVHNSLSLSYLLNCWSVLENYLLSIFVLFLSLSISWIFTDEIARQTVVQSPVRVLRSFRKSYGLSIHTYSIPANSLNLYRIRYDSSPNTIDVLLWAEKVFRRRKATYPQARLLGCAYFRTSVWPRSGDKFCDLSRDWTEHLHILSYVSNYNNNDTLIAALQHQQQEQRVWDNRKSKGKNSNGRARLWVCVRAWDGLTAGSVMLN